MRTTKQRPWDAQGDTYPNLTLTIVQVSLLGSILSNLLLVLGCAFFFGGLRYQHQTFNKTACSLNSGMLMISVMCAMLPSYHPLPRAC